MSILDRARATVPITSAKLPVKDLFAAPNVAPLPGQVQRAPVHESMGRVRSGIEHSPEVDRVAAVPRRPVRDLDAPESHALALEVTARFGLKRTTCDCRAKFGAPCLSVLKPAQAWALDELGSTPSGGELPGGMISPIGVGHGKTLIDLLAPLALPGCKVAVLLVPPGLVRQLEREYLRAREHFRVPSLIMPKGAGYIVRGAPVLHVVPYSMFSRAESTKLLKQIGPDTIIADEAHRLKAKDTATTSRVLRYFLEFPDTRLVAWSGTLTSKSVRDYAHLAALALGPTSPLPIAPPIVEEWSLALDPIDWPAPMGALRVLCRPGEAIRDGYKRRLHETHGVTGTKAAPVDASLVLTERKAPAIPEAIRGHLKVLREGWMRPDGEELVDAMRVATAARELACGFYYRWEYPFGHIRHDGGSTCTCVADGLRHGAKRCAACGKVIEHWFKIRSAWHRELREMLKDRAEHLDSELLCVQAATRGWAGYTGPLPTWKPATFPEWQLVKASVEPVPVAVWLDDYLARDAAEWGRTHRGVIWYGHAAFGKRLAEVSGLPLHTGGPDAEARILAEKGATSIIASIKAHGTGRDGLQLLFKEQLVANPPTLGLEWEQLLGRLHRIGQDADEVTTHVYRHTEEYRDAIDRAIHQANYIEGTMGTLQKLLSVTPTW